MELGNSVRFRKNGPVTVSASVLSMRDSQEIFGAPLWHMGIQPIWISVRNDDAVPYWFFPASIDSNYFSAAEVAARLGEPPEGGVADVLREGEMPQFIDPGETADGFVFTNLTLGTKPIVVELIGPGLTRAVELFVPAPGLEVDHSLVDFSSLYPEGEVVDLVDEPSLRSALAAMPSTVTGEDGAGTGDPVNVIVVGSPERVVEAFVGGGWDEAEPSTRKAMANAVKAFMLRRPYEHTLFSPLWVFGRRQDVSLQKPRRTINQRNHLRLWMAPVRYQGKAVWVGTISRDLGVRATMRTWPPITHAIAPDVDEARTFLLEQMILAKVVAKVGFVSGAAAASADEPRENLTGDLYHSDGKRIVLFLADVGTSADQVDLLLWDWPKLYEERFAKWAPQATAPSSPLPPRGSEG